MTISNLGKFETIRFCLSLAQQSVIYYSHPYRILSLKKIPIYVSFQPPIFPDSFQKIDKQEG